MKSNRRQKAVYIALCVLAAIVVWVFVDNFGNNGGPVMHTKWFRDVPVTYTGETVLTERGFMLLEEDTVSTVDLEMEGTLVDLALLDKDYIRVTVDLSNVSRTGVQTASSVIYGYTEEYFRQNITVSDRTPSTITINVAELYHKTVDVRCELAGNVAEGYSAGELQISPTEIEVRGDQADVDAVSYVKVSLDLGQDATSTVTAELPVQFYDAEGRLMEDTSLQATYETIQVTLPVYVTKELQLTMDFQESPGARLDNVDWEIEPHTILVSGPAELLNGMDSIVLDEFDLASLGTTTNYSYAIPIPEGCENISGVTRATLHISFQDMLRTTVGTSSFQLANEPEGRQVSVLTDRLAVIVFGTAADVSAVTEEDILVTVDLSDFGSAAGTYTVPAEVTVPGHDVGVLGTYQVRVTIEEIQTEEPEPDSPGGEDPAANPDTGDETT